MGTSPDRISEICYALPPKDDSNRDLTFDRRIQKRGAVLVVLEAAGRILWPYGLGKQDADNLLAQDIWQVFRHQLWLDDPDRDKLGYCVDGNDPLLQSGEPAVKCVKIGFSGREEKR